MSEDLRNAYANTLFSGHFSASFEFRPGATSPKSDAILTLFDVQSATLITAWNPYSEPRSEDENRAAQTQLENELSAQGIRFISAVGQGADGDWPAEPGVLALGLEFMAAQNLAVKYQQNAYLWIEKGFPAELIYPDPDAIADQAAVVVVDSREQSTLASSWREYLCVRRLGDRIELSLRMYEWLASVSDLSENEEGELIVPIQIDGKAVVGVEDDAVVGGDLGYNSDDECALFDQDDLAAAHSWIGVGWHEDVLERVSEAFRSHSMRLGLV